MASNIVRNGCPGRNRDEYQRGRHQRLRQIHPGPAPGAPAGAAVDRARSPVLAAELAGRTG